MGFLLDGSRCKNKKLTQAAKLLALGQLITTRPEDESQEKEVDEALAAFGLVAEGPTVQNEPFHLWPECEQVFRFWRGIQTQWHKDFNGRLARLDFQAVDLVMKWEGIPKKQQKELTDYLRAMEIAVLNALANQG